MRFAFSFPQVRATVGSTSRPENLSTFLRLTAPATVAPLPTDIVEALEMCIRDRS